MARKELYFYYKLADLEECVPRKHFKVAKDYIKDDGKVVKKYSYFSSHVDFNNFLFLYVSEKDRVFYEVITSPLRKMYYDIDIDISKHPNLECIFNLGYVYNLIDNLVQKTIEYFQILYKNLSFNPSTDVFICSSNGKYKYSYHIIFQYWIQGHENLIFIYDKVMVNFPFERDNNIVDRGVYGKKQLFRFLFNHKLDDYEQRVKIPVFRWFYKNKEIINEYDGPIKYELSEGMYLNCLMNESMITQASKHLEFIDIPRMENNVKIKKII